jgi:hypothetical protein
MAKDLLARRDQKPWQAIEQNQRDGRRRFERTGSRQPNPWAGCRHTAHSSPRGCQPRSRAVPESDMAGLHHAASRRSAPNTRERMALRLKLKVISAEA